jgi:hypothetical protein
MMLLVMQLLILIKNSCVMWKQLGLTCVLPMLEAMKSLSKHAQNMDTFICDFVSAVKLCHFEIYNMYVDLET